MAAERRRRGTYVPLLMLAVVAALVVLRHGSATHFTLANMMPAWNWDTVNFWSQIAFAFTGLELVSAMSEEVRDPRRTLPRAVFGAGALIASCTSPEPLPFSRWCPPPISTRRAASSTPSHWLHRAKRRLPRSSRGHPGHRGQCRRRRQHRRRHRARPFVVGIDRYLPAAFGKIHPRWKTPYISILVQAILSGSFCSSARSTRRRAAPINSSSTPPSFSTSFRFSTCSRPSSSWRAAKTAKRIRTPYWFPADFRRLDLRRAWDSSSSWSASLFRSCRLATRQNKLGFELKLVGGTEPQISRAFVLWSLLRLYVEVNSVETVCRMTAIELDDLAHSIKQLVSMFSRLVGVGAREQRFTRMLARCIISIRCMKSFSSDGALAAENET
jgi:hypothetical protein